MLGSGQPPSDWNQLLAECRAANQILHKTKLPLINVLGAGKLRQTARQHKEKGVSSTFVAVADETSTEMLGFYAVSLAELVNANLSAQYGKRLPAKVPVFRLGRLVTALHHRRKGVGEYMLFDAIDRVTRIAKEVGGIGLVVNAKLSAVEFYQRYGFEQMTDHPQNLFLPF